MFGFFFIGLLNSLMGWSPGEFNLFLMLVILSVCGFLFELFCVYHMVKPLKISFKKIFVFTIFMRFIAFCLSFFKLPLAGILGLLFAELKIENSDVMMFSALLMSALILSFIKIMVAISYFKTLSRSRIIGWLLLSNIIGYLLPFYFVYHAFAYNWEAGPVLLLMSLFMRT